MNTAYFSKVSISMSWNELKKNIIDQKEKNTIPLPFIIVAKIDISTTDFDSLSLVLLQSNSIYTRYSALSVATLQGVWGCILINCSDDSRNILVYTGGNTYPLYASILDI